VLAAALLGAAACGAAGDPAGPDAPVEPDTGLDAGAGEDGSQDAGGPADGEPPGDAEPSGDGEATADAEVIADGPFDVAPSGSPEVSPDGADPLPADASPTGPSDAEAPPDSASDQSASYPSPSYTRLSETGLYRDLASRALSAGLEEFQPTYQLWSDGAEKRRWVQLPPGTKIDSSNMDRWVLPVGTRFWKQFSIGGVLLETRLVERYGTGPQDYWMGAFVWRADQADAILAEDGQENINGTSHDAPGRKDCGACHNGEPGRALGFSALQLSREGDGLTLATLAGQGRLSDAPPPGAPFHPPGDPAAASVLGYLHANCGHCHNIKGTSWPDTQMVLRLETGEATVETTAIYRTLLGQKLQYWRNPGFDQRVVPGDPAASALLFRMQARGSRDQMPPLATEIVDGTGAGMVMSWIASLPR
jgi:hypothetical protein